MKRLAQSIDALTEKDAHYRQMTQDVSAVRRAAACELYGICRNFVDGINRLLAKTELALDPDQFSEVSFQENTVNLIQISVRGRILQIAFSITPQLVCTEDFPRALHPLRRSSRF